jgi:hypothetical protein
MHHPRRILHLLAIPTAAITCLQLGGIANAANMPPRANQ